MDILPRNPKTEANQTSQDGLTSHLDNAPSKAQKNLFPSPAQNLVKALHLCNSRQPIAAIREINLRNVTVSPHQTCYPEYRE